MRSILICGVDEAGRGPLAGSVVAAAVVLTPLAPISGIKDSKKLSQARRDILFDEIISKSKGWGVGEASVEEIDRLNILKATMLAMQRAVESLCRNLGEVPGMALIDGNRCPVLLMPAEAIVKGDSKVQSISAASIIAKVTRDRQMLVLHERFPQYGFSQHMGYPTKAHLAAINKYGVCIEHRRSFSPVRNALNAVVPNT